MFPKIGGFSNQNRLFTRQKWLPTVHGTLSRPVAIAKGKMMKIRW
jgi:hypothetical protein